MSSSPTTAPGPVTMLSTPAGSPPSVISSASRSVASGVVLAGFTTTVLPTAMAGAILLTISVSGKFHGIIAPTTPMGLRTTSPIAFWDGKGTCLPDIAPPATSPA